MTSSIITNSAAINAQRNLRSTSDALNTSMTRLSSGLRINSAKDDAAGMQISNRLTSNINGMGVAIRNANDGISMAQTAEGALLETTNILQRMRDLALQSANGTNSASDRKAIQEEIAQLQKEIDRIAETTTFGDQKLLDGSFGSKAFQVGANANETIDVTIPDKSADELGSYAWGARTGWGSGGLLPDPFLALSNPQTFWIEGYKGDAEISVPKITDSSSRYLADQINQFEESTGVSAFVYTDVAIHAFGNAVNDPDSVSFDITVGTVTTSVVNATSHQDIINQINRNSSESGITASYESNIIGSSNPGVVIHEPNGENVHISQAQVEPPSATAVYAKPAPRHDQITRNVNGYPLALYGVTFFGILELDSDKPFTFAEGSPNGHYQIEDYSVSDIDVSTYFGAQYAIGVIDDALQQVDSTRAQLGAVQNRLQHTIANLSVTAENSEASRSRIRDTDFAKETTEQVKQQILQQAGTSVLAQANQLPQAMLSLLNN